MLKPIPSPGCACEACRDSQPIKPASIASHAAANALLELVGQKANAAITEAMLCRQSILRVRSIMREKQGVAGFSAIIIIISVTNSLSRDFAWPNPIFFKRKCVRFLRLVKESL